jgi:poly(A) polymerase
VLDFAAFRGDDLKSDLLGRDFTMNALALDIQSPDRLIDPLGGAADLRAGQIRACSPAAFEDDPARVLRAVRQSLEFKFKILPETYSAMQSATPGLARVAVERQRDELFRMLDGRGVASGVRILDRLGVLQPLLPELAALKGLAQGENAPDAWEHTLALVQELERFFNILVGRFDEAASSNLVHGTAVLYLGAFREQLGAHFKESLNPQRSLRALLMLAGLLHDTGKPTSRQVDADGSLHFRGHDQAGAPIAFERARRLALSQVECRRVETIVRNHMRVHLLRVKNANMDSRTIYRYFRATGEAGIDVCLLSLADMLAAHRNAVPQPQWQRQLEICQTLMDAWWNKRNEIVNPPRLVNGEDILSISSMASGAWLGQLLEVIREEQAAGSLHDREAALAFARKWMAEYGQEVQDEKH